MIDPNMTSSTPIPSPRKPVGITKGPGETIHEYTFVSRDDEQGAKRLTKDQVS